MTTAVIALPILAGKAEAWRRLCQEMRGGRRQEYEASRHELGIVREMAWLFNASHGSVALIYVDVGEPEHFLARLAASEQPFDCWFKRQLVEICGLDLRRLGPNSVMELVFDWRQTYEEK
jgi:hypothetical protein